MEPQLDPSISATPQAWSLIGGVLCVSRFVESYLQAWAPPGTFASGTTAPTFSSGTPTGLPPPFLPRLRVVPLSAWGCFGEPPFPDIGGGVAQRLRALAGQPAHRGEAGGAAAQRSEEQQRSGETSDALGSPPFCIGVLKLTPEKGCSIVFELARRLPHRRYESAGGRGRGVEAEAEGWRQRQRGGGRGVEAETRMCTLHPGSRDCGTIGTGRGRGAVPCSMVGRHSSQV